MVNNTKKRKLIKKRGGGNTEKPASEALLEQKPVEVNPLPEGSLEQKQVEVEPVPALEEVKKTEDEVENQLKVPQPVEEMPATLVPVEQPSLPPPPQLNSKMSNALKFADETDKLVKNSELEISATNNVENTRSVQLNRTLKAVIKQLKMASEKIRSLSNPMKGGYKKTKKRGGKFTKYPY